MSLLTNHLSKKRLDFIENMLYAVCEHLDLQNNVPKFSPLALMLSGTSLIPNNNCNMQIVNFIADYVLPFILFLLLLIGVMFLFTSVSYQQQPTTEVLITATELPTRYVKHQHDVATSTTTVLEEAKEYENSETVEEEVENQL